MADGKKITSIKNNSAVTTVSDLRDFYFDDLPLTSEQVLAIKSFDKHRIHVLQSIEEDQDQEFQKKYMDLLVLENTIDYREILKNFKIKKGKD